VRPSGKRGAPPKSAIVPSQDPRSRTSSPQGSATPRLAPADAADQATRLRANIERAVRGKSEVVRRAVETVIAGGHLLLEDVPGVGKTTLAHALARSLRATFRRIQFTSDLLPSDVVGVSLPGAADGVGARSFVFQPGPIFAHVVLADEVNRASPKTQSALLEAMGEGSVSVDGVSHALPQPFLVIATQNPMEQFGTHPLPESQLDRFLMRLRLGYPAPADEAAVLRDDPATTELPRLEPVLSTDDVRALRESAAAVKFDDALVAYLLRLVAETREHDGLRLGVSPRGAVALRRAAQARALVEGRDFCIPDDVRDLALDVFGHRVSVDAHGAGAGASEQAEWILREILERTPIPL
jgi:MoxR-like ATPase